MSSFEDDSGSDSSGDNTKLKNSNSVMMGSKPKFKAVDSNKSKERGIITQLMGT